MKFLKIKLLVFAVMMFAASSAFAMLENVDTSSLNGQQGYLYFQYDPFNNAAASTAIVSNFTTDGTLGATAPGAFTIAAYDGFDSGQYVSGTLPATVSFANGYSVNDYNQAITFGNSLSFDLSFAPAAPIGPTGGASTFSLGLFEDAMGTPFLTIPDGTVFTTDLTNVPEPATALLLGFGLLGLAGLRRRAKN